MLPKHIIKELIMLPKHISYIGHHASKTYYVIEVIKLPKHVISKKLILFLNILYHRGHHAS